MTGAYDPEEKDETQMRLLDEMYARAQRALDRPARAKELVYVEPGRMSSLVPLT